MWALFANGTQVSRAFETEIEAWHLARKSALMNGGDISLVPGELGGAAFRVVLPVAQV